MSNPGDAVPPKDRFEAALSNNDVSLGEAPQMRPGVTQDIGGLLAQFRERAKLHRGIAASAADAFARDPEGNKAQREVYLKHIGIAEQIQELEGIVEDHLVAIRPGETAEQVIERVAANTAKRPIRG